MRVTVEGYRTMADRVLLGVFLAFLLALGIRYSLGGFWSDLLLSVMQAALIGGLADWFAVTALFTKPLGISWHTALIPRNRSKIIEAVAIAVEKDLLSPVLLMERLDAWRPAKGLINWLDGPEGRRLFLVWAQAALARLAGRLDRDALAGQLAGYIRRGAAGILEERQPRFGRWLLAGRRDEQILDLFLDKLHLLLMAESTAAALHTYLEDIRRREVTSPLAQLAVWLGEETDSLNLEDAARILQQQCADLILQLKLRRHPIRRRLRLEMLAGYRRLRHDGAAAAYLRTWQNDVIGRMPIEEVLRDLLRGPLDRQLAGGFQGMYHSPLLVWLLGQVSVYWGNLKNDEDFHAWIDSILRQALHHLLGTQHAFIGRVVREALTKLSDEDLSHFVAEKVGDDLAWIRINGSLVGGAVGCLLFLFHYFVYDPYVVPVVRSWLE